MWSNNYRGWCLLEFDSFVCWGKASNSWKQKRRTLELPDMDKVANIGLCNSVWIVVWVMSICEAKLDVGHYV